ncbi:hypothetical protein RJ40_02395 [Methanofollis aquaemaris]|uniref:Uncharacterized protein n=1 Tax=Methanofollis aquaemaris TaxID=126734 RepID=A0A8A3S236_9EURY|nr:hypothetical protein [Methanofollis aquaemaris]QSZ66427.1 hypothetical protein RJ40_02395 [Methanofollis aquaemaris]
MTAPKTLFDILQETGMTLNFHTHLRGSQCAWRNGDECRCYGCPGCPGGVANNPCPGAGSVCRHSPGCSGCPRTCDLWDADDRRDSGEDW